MKESIVAQVVEVLPSVDFWQPAVVPLEIEFGKVSQGSEVEVVYESHVGTMEDIAKERVRLLIL